MKHLQKARGARNNEFYTRKSDIYSELPSYSDHFKDKVVYCNCDSVDSEFVKYFTCNKDWLGIKEILFTGMIDGEGVDFRSEYSISLLKRADIVVTNPPFSLILPYLKQLLDNKKKFLFLGPRTLLSRYPAVNSIADGKLWLGNKRVTHFDTSEGLLDVGAFWYTNLEHDGMYPGVSLTHEYDPAVNIRYDNFDAINVDKTSAIPLDYYGAIGVPVTFLTRYNPKQFEILGLTNRLYTGDLRTKLYDGAAKQLNFCGKEANASCVVVTEDGYTIKFQRVLIRRRQ